MSQGQPGEPPEYTEEELRALEAEMERITIDDVLLQTIVSLINLTARKAGLAHAPDDPARPQPDWEQVRTGIDAARALLAIVEPRHGAQLAPVRDGLSQLQMHYVRATGGQAPAAEPAPPQGGQQTPPQPPSGAQPGGGQRSGRLWVPGQ